MPASSRGYHYIQEYRDCPRKFYYHQIAKLEPEKKAPALLFGEAVHAAIADWWITRDIESAIDAGQSSLEKNSSQFKYIENLADCRIRLPALILEWKNTTLEENESFDKSKPEVEFSFDLENKNTITGRVDSLLIRGKYLFLGEVKTTSWSLQSALDTLQYNDQMTLYSIFAQTWAKQNKLEFCGGLVDVLYSRGRVTEVRREPFHRSNEQIADYLGGAVKTLEDIEDLRKTAESGWYLTPKCYRNPSACEFCPYGVICAGHRVQTLDELAQTPAGFTKVE